MAEPSQDPAGIVAARRSAGDSDEQIRSRLAVLGYHPATVDQHVPAPVTEPAPTSPRAGKDARRRAELAAARPVGRPFSVPTDDDLDGDEPVTEADRAMFKAREAAPRTQSRRVAPAPGRTPTMPRILPSGGGDYAGAVLGVLGMALVVNYMRGGPDQVKAWLRAKFLNQVPTDVGPPAGTVLPSMGTAPAGSYNARVIAQLQANAKAGK